ncbi:PAS-domain containing protein [Marivita sp. S6314]|uniref:PAS-domain containing protein n=1 Tax=Marivita sp. S6314 TaxID=2926406 RepID=UPI001FF32860|nr:PAS-domain containing protein [Marivita sp. S6314]MCK0151214.1 PAS-domain containing protein [Marivita sp. S6314]
MDICYFVGVLFGLVCAGSVVVLLARRKPAPDTVPDLSPEYEIALLFRDDHLVDAHDVIWSMLSGEPGAPTWADVRQALHSIVPAFPATATSPLGDPGHSGIDVRVTHLGAVTRVSLVPLVRKSEDWFAARQDDLALDCLRPALDLAPSAIWAVDEHGMLLWANAMFDRLAEDLGGTHALAETVATQCKSPTALGTKRITLRPKTGRDEHWFDVSTHETDAGTLYFATAVDAVVQAEEAQRNFVQTLSKTFANLTTGLAIFNRDRRLALFNPALIDLSGLSAEFLSGRPNLFEFFDKLREHQIMPEPKNYDDWRERMAKLVAAASDDRFRETWNLPDGQTYDVTGQPYPDGAIAFLLNDITAEVSLTRGFRSELETMQSLIDAMDDAVAVFNQQGILTVCNAAYKTAWNVDPDTSIADANILDATQDWKTGFHPNPVWPEIRDFVTRTSERASWDADLRSRDGRDVTCRIDPICFGATLIRFCVGAKSSGHSGDSDHLEIVSA